MNTGIFYVATVMQLSGKKKMQVKELLAIIQYHKKH